MPGNPCALSTNCTVSRSGAEFVVDTKCRQCFVGGSLLHLWLPLHAMIQVTIPPSQLQHQPMDHCCAGSRPTACHGRDPRCCPSRPVSRPVEQGLSMVSRRRRQFLAVERSGQVILYGLDSARQQENQPRICRRARKAGTGKEKRGDNQRYTSSGVCLIAKLSNRQTPFNQCPCVK